jgi:hypothetical protein
MRYVGIPDLGQYGDQYQTVVTFELRTSYEHLFRQDLSAKLKADFQQDY